MQTDVMVFDRQGRFVSDLKPEQFELRVDGKVQAISFFEVISSGSPHDEEVWAKEAVKTGTPPPQTPATSSDQGRTILFFLDDWHLSADSVMRSRVALSNLINTSVGPRDRISVFAASGQLGSTQLLSSDKAALIALVEKLNFQSAGVEDLEWPAMNEAEAAAICLRDSEVVQYFVEAMLGHQYHETDQSDFLKREWMVTHAREIKLAAETVIARATNLAETSAGISERTLAALRSLLISAASLPGRKLIFLLSDGFVLQTKRSDIVSRVRTLTEAAARSGVVIYTLDSRGLVSGMADLSKNRGPDRSNSLLHSGVSMITRVQDGLNALASDTGGRFLKNTNALDTAMITTLEEISRYYLMSWYLDPASVKPGHYSKIRVTVKGRSDLSVRVRQGDLDLSQLVREKK